MKSILICISLAITFISCVETGTTTKRLKSYLSSWGYDIRDFRIICLIPADGCVSCINPFLDYSKDSSEGFLLALTSIFEKSIEYTIEVKGLDETKILCDMTNNGIIHGLGDVIYPTIYFIENGHVFKVVNTSTLPDKAALFDEMNKALKDCVFKTGTQ